MASLLFCQCINLRFYSSPEYYIFDVVSICAHFSLTHSCFNFFLMLLLDTPFIVLEDGVFFCQFLLFYVFRPSSILDASFLIWYCFYEPCIHRIIMIVTINSVLISICLLDKNPAPLSVIHPDMFVKYDNRWLPIIDSVSVKFSKLSFYIIYPMNLSCLNIFFSVLLPLCFLKFKFHIQCCAKISEPLR